MTPDTICIYNRLSQVYCIKQNRRKNPLIHKRSNAHFELHGFYKYVDLIILYSENN